MAKGIRYSEEFKQEAVNQVVIHGYSVADVAARLGISKKPRHSLQVSIAPNNPLFLETTALEESISTFCSVSKSEKKSFERVIAV